MSKNNHTSEIIIGIVAPLGTDKDKDKFIRALTERFEEYSYHVEDTISITKLIFNNKINQLNNSKKLKLYLKMQMCSILRKTYCDSIMACLAVNKINKQRKKSYKKTVYIIDQLKHPAEHKIFSHIYGISYVQISLFSNQIKRDSSLRKLLENDNEQKTLDNSKDFFIDYTSNNKFEKAYKALIKMNIIDSYKKEILPDGAHKLIEKDMFDTDRKNFTEEHGQRLSDIFHLSHYFFNLDKGQSTTDIEIEKLLKLLFGRYKNFPTQDEFGMALAYHASYRSTFPNRRHVGACIISPYGEVISVASVRAPTPSANTSIEQLDNIKQGYEFYKEKYNGIKNKISAFKEKNPLKVNKKHLDEIIKYLDIDTLYKFINESIDFHPTSHAEMSALADAAKMGISVRGATLYTTTFPCHICAKDIITFGIKKVVYLEQYPKSKNAELYPELISFDDEDTANKLPCIMFSGVGPRRYHYVYQLDNKPKNNLNEEKTEDHSNQIDIPNLLRYEKPTYNEEREKEIKSFFARIIKEINENGGVSEKTRGAQLFTIFGVLKNNKKK